MPEIARRFNARIPLCDGMVRLRYHAGFEQQDLIARRGVRGQRRAHKLWHTPGRPSRLIAASRAAGLETGE